MPYAVDINGTQLHQGDIVRCTQKRKDEYPGSTMEVGDELRIDEIYMHVDGEVAGHLYWIDGSGSIFHTTLSLYEKVEKPTDATL